MLNKIIIATLLAVGTLSASAQSYKYNQTTIESKTSAVATLTGPGTSNSYIASKGSYVVSSNNTLNQDNWSAIVTSNIAHDIIAWSSVVGNGTANTYGTGYSTLLGKTSTGFTDPSYSSSAIMAQVDMGTYDASTKLQWNIATTANQGAILSFIGNSAASVNVTRNGSITTVINNETTIVVIAKQLSLDGNMLNIGATEGSFGINNTTYGNTNDR